MKEKLVQAFGGLLDSAIAAAPKVVVGILLVIVGLVVAKLIEKALRYAVDQGPLRRTGRESRY